MFVQVIKAKVKDKNGVAAEKERWDEEIKPGADGFLGSTGGVTDDGRLILMARFESEEAARRNSERPEQSQWWEAMSAHLDGEATFHESTDITTYRGGGDDTARFVQVMQGRVNDIEAARRLNEKMEAELPKRRPDVLGGLTATYDNGNFSDFVYFTSLEEARQGEKAMTEDPPPEMEAWGQLMVGEITFYDLEDPWISS